jgi:hypothetical protein
MSEGDVVCYRVVIGGRGGGGFVKEEELCRRGDGDGGAKRIGSVPGNIQDRLL